MDRFKKCNCNCNSGGNVQNPCPPVVPDPQCRPQGMLGVPDPFYNGDVSCFNVNNLPNIQDVKTLAHKLCEVQQKFDKCPQYYTKSDYEALLDTLNKSLFYLYVKMNQMIGSPWFMGLAYLDTDPVDAAKQDRRDLPGWYIASTDGKYDYFLNGEGDDGGEPIVISEEDFTNNLIIFKPKVLFGCTFQGFEVIKVKLGDFEKIWTEIEKLDERITILEGETVVLQQSVTHYELFKLIYSDSLNPGQEYRITDYTFTTTTYNTESAGHDFDIIVVADTTNTLNENARAVAKEGDTYFENSNLAAWEIKYTIYNNKNVHYWADPINGKGVIYWMKDEFDNEAGYDFKNLIYKIDNKQVYTFSKLDDTDLSISGIDCYSNYIAPYFTDRLNLPENIIQGSHCKLGTACYKVQILNGIFIDIEAHNQNLIIKSESIIPFTNKKFIVGSFNNQEIIIKEDKLNIPEVFTSSNFVFNN